MNKLNYEILSAIDNIDSSIMESEMNVINSLMGSYGKAVAVLEYCDDNTDVGSFDIFQESVIMEADENNTNGEESKVKKIINKIIDFFKMIGDLLKRGADFIKKKVGKIFNRSKQEDIKKAQEAVGDDTVTVEIKQEEDGKPEVKVTTSSHDTQKEEQIKSKVESVVSSIKMHTYGKNGGTLELPDVTPIIIPDYAKGTTAAPMEQAPPKYYLHEYTCVTIGKHGVEITYKDISPFVEKMGKIVEKVNEFFINLDIDRMTIDTVYASDKRIKFYKIICPPHEEFVKAKATKAKDYSDFVNYTNNMKKAINSQAESIKKCSDIIKKTLAEYQKNISRMIIPEPSNSWEAPKPTMIMKYLNEIQHDIKQSIINEHTDFIEILDAETRYIDDTIKHLTFDNIEYPEKHYHKGVRQEYHQMHRK